MCTHVKRYHTNDSLIICWMQFLPKLKINSGELRTCVKQRRAPFAYIKVLYNVHARAYYVFVMMPVLQIQYIREN